MLDLEVVTPPTATGLDIVTLDEMRSHLRITSTALNHDIEEAVKDAAEYLCGFQGQPGILNRTVFPTTLRRYLRSWPPRVAGNRRMAIQLPYPPTIDIVGITYEDPDGGSPENAIDALNYTLVLRDQVSEVRFWSDYSWPALARVTRPVAVTYRAGYLDGAYPQVLKRLIKMLAAHFYENPEATVIDRIQGQVSRKVEFGADHLIAKLRVTPAYDDWD